MPWPMPLQVSASCSFSDCSTCSTWTQYDSRAGQVLPSVRSTYSKSYSVAGVPTSPPTPSPTAPTGDLM
jgi:hypothetical protein